MSNKNDETSIIECERCLLTSKIDPRIYLAKGECQHCRAFTANAPRRISSTGLDAIVDSISRRGAGNQYDCVVGVSGGVDSSYLLLKVHNLGLRALAVHIDNGWNSNLAVSNIQKITAYTSTDLYTEVLELNAFNNLQKAFLMASVPDLEIPTDHAIQASLWKNAEKFGVPTIITGMNYATESSGNVDWSYGHSDWKYILAVWKRFGNPDPDNYPHYSLFDLIWMSALKRIRSVSLLNYFDFSKKDAQDFLIREIGWEPYEGKHFESVYTRWIQGYFLPRKFGIDKRYIHLSDLIRSGQLSRSLARTELGREHYSPDARLLDQRLIQKKLGLQDSELEGIIALENRGFRDFPNSYLRSLAFRKSLALARHLRIYPR